jgi:type II secretory pathway component PulK
LLRWIIVASRDNRDGFVLFSVIWIAGLLAVIATTFAISTRLHIKSQANLTQSYQAEVEADGIARLIAYRLAQARLIDNASFSLPMDGSLVSCALANKAQAFVAVQDQAGLIDLNQTSPAALTMILKQLGAPQAELIARALVDFRDQDQTLFEGNGEEVSLVTGGPGLKNAAFQSVDEIAQAIPESMADLSDLSSLFTVYSLISRCNDQCKPAIYGPPCPCRRTRLATPRYPAWQWPPAHVLYRCRLRALSRSPGSKPECRRRRLLGLGADAQPCSPDSGALR